MQFYIAPGRELKFGRKDIATQTSCQGEREKKSSIFKNRIRRGSVTFLYFFSNAGFPVPSFSRFNDIRRGGFRDSGNRFEAVAFCIIN